MTDLDRSGSTSLDSAVEPSALGAQPAVIFDAFISYRQQPLDKRWAKRLQRWLEAYRTPKTLVAQHGIRPRLERVFRDADELSASADLGADIERALRASRYLIVVCSRSTPSSRWVNEEILRFRQLGREDRILALLIDGEPREAFPGALYDLLASQHAIGDADSLSVTDLPARKEPLAADVRHRHGDSRRQVRQLAFLRLLAPILGCRLDDLRQRESQRTLRRLRWIVAGSITALTVVAVLGFTAWTQRDSAVQTLAEMYAERGRLEWLEQRPTRALAFLAASNRLGSPSLPARRLLRQALVRVVPSRTFVDEHFVAATGTPDGSLITEHRGHRMTLWTPALRTSRQLFTQPGSPALVLTTKDGLRTAVIDRDGTGRLWETMTGRLIKPIPPVGPSVYRAQLDRLGTCLVTASTDDTARLWLVETGEVFEWTPHVAPPPRRPDLKEAAIRSISLSEDGTQVLTLGADGLARLWGVPPRQPPLTFRATGTKRDVLSLTRKIPLAIVSAALSDNGRLVATLSNAGAIDLWDGSTGAYLHSVSAPTNRPGRQYGWAGLLQFSPDSLTLLIYTMEGTFFSWNTEIRQLFEPSRMRGAFGSRAVGEFSPDGSLLATAFQGTTTVWSTQGRHGFEALVSVDGWGQVGFVPPGELLLLQESTIKTWSLRKLLPLLLGVSDPPHAHRGRVTAARFNHDGSRVVTAAEDRTVKIWNAATGNLVNTDCLFTSGVSHFDLSPDGRHLFASGQDGSVCHVLTETGQEAKPFLENGVPVRARFARYSPNGERLVMMGTDWLIRIWDVRSRVLLSILPEEVLPCSRLAGTSPDVSQILTVRDDGRAEIWNASNGDHLVTLAGRLNVRGGCATFSPDGLRILTGHEDEGPRIWDSRTGQLVATLKSPTISLYRSTADLEWVVAFNPGATLVVTAFAGESPTLWDVGTGEQLSILEGERSVHSIDFSPQGDLILTVGDAGAKLWDVQSGALVQIVDSRRGSVLAASFDRRGERVVTVGEELPAIWDIRPEDRSAGEIDQLIDCFGSWRIEAGKLVERDPRPKECASRSSSPPSAALERPRVPLIPDGGKALIGP